MWLRGKGNRRSKQEQEVVKKRSKRRGTGIGTQIKEDQAMMFDLMNILTYMSSIATADIRKDEIFELAGQQDGITARLLKKIHLLARNYGYDYATACRLASEEAHHPALKDFLIRFSNALATGEEEAVDDEAEGGGEEDENEMMEIMKNDNKNPIRVLHVEDEKGALEITKLFLERKGQNDFEVTQALSAEQGLEKPENGNFDVVISDYRMPGMDGLEVGEVEELRKDDEGWIGEISTGKGRGRIYKRLREEG